MDQMQSVQQNGHVMSHIVQVYQPSVTDSKITNPQIIHISHPSLQTSQGNITYQQSITSESIHIPVKQHVDEMQNHQMQTPQNQIMMSTQPTHIHQPIQAQVLQNSDLSSLQVASHVILPQVPVFKQHMLLNSIQQPYYTYEGFPNDRTCILAKQEMKADTHLQNETTIENASENTTEFEVNPVKKKMRSQIPNPSNWACNVRKIKHQRGEAYISRRGKYVPERKIKNTKDCLKTCKYKCNERISDNDRELIFKAFYSLNANEKKHFLLNTTERSSVKHSKLADGPHKRKYSFRYFFLVRAMRYTVCKNFYLGTLAISQKPVYNVHISKSEVNVPKPDGRGLSEASAHALPSEVKERVRNHILSFHTIDGKPIKQYSRKKQYLDSSLSIKQMYTMYYKECSKDSVVPVKESMYRKIFNREFNLYFKRVKRGQLCCKCKGSIKPQTESVAVQTQ